MNMFVHFSLLESTSAQQKTSYHDQNFVLFQNMNLEMSWLFLFKTIEGLFERPEKLFVTVNQQVFVYPTSLFSNMQTIVGANIFEE